MSAYDDFSDIAVMLVPGFKKYVLKAVNYCTGTVVYETPTAAKTLEVVKDVANRVLSEYDQMDDHYLRIEDTEGNQISIKTDGDWVDGNIPIVNAVKPGGCLENE